MNNFEDRTLLEDFVGWLMVNANSNKLTGVRMDNQDIDSLVNAFLMSPYYHPRIVDAVSDIRLNVETSHIPEPHM